MSPNATPASAPPASRGRDQNKDSRVSSRTTKDTRLSSTTRLCFRALILAAGTVATNAQGGISAQGGMYYPYGSTFGPMYGSGPLGVVGPFGGITAVGGTPGVSLGGAPRFFGGGGGGYGGRYGVRDGGVYGGGGYGRGGGVYRRGLRETPAVTPDPSPSPATCADSIWDIVRSRDDLSSLRALLENDLPWVAAALDGKEIGAGMIWEDVFPKDAPYDPDALGLVPLFSNNTTGTFHMDTLFAPNDAAIEALREYLLGGTVDESTDDDASATESATESDLSTEKKKVPTALEMLGAGNATTATAFLAYHVLPDRRVSLGELVDGSLLKTALGGSNRLMVTVRKGDSDVVTGDDETKASTTTPDETSTTTSDAPVKTPPSPKQVVLRAAGSQAGVVTEAGLDACNGRVFVVDHVLLPVDVDGVTTPEQNAQFEKIAKAIERETTGAGANDETKDDNDE